MSASGKSCASRARSRRWTKNRCRRRHPSRLCPSSRQQASSLAIPRRPAMFDPGGYLWLILAFPLAASVVTGLLGPRLLRERSHLPCIAAALASCVLSFMVLVFLVGYGYRTASYYIWFQTGNVDVGFTLRADALTAIMLVTVTFISSVIAIYSAGYMHGDPGYARFFAEISLFIFSMTGLVLADNLLLLYAFW